ncbi:MAG TPA: hypothetical protein VIN34_01375 [Candidatus Limnocylindria bacterium]
MKRILPATLLGAILAMGSIGAVAAYAATPTPTGTSAITEAGSGTEAAEAPGDTGTDPAGGLDTNVNTDGQFDGEQ